MHVNLRNATIFVLLSGAAIATWLGGRPPATDTARRASPGEVPLGYYLENATFLGTDDDGRVRYRVFAAQFNQAAHGDAMEFERLRVEYAPQSGIRWSVTAERGSAPSDRSYLDLEQGVRLTNNPEAGDPVTIETDAMRLHPETSVVSSDGMVTMRWGNGYLESMGLKADLEKDFLEFISNVSARFSP